MFIYEDKYKKFKTGLQVKIPDNKIQIRFSENKNIKI
jgi:hypothetical protein